MKPKIGQIVMIAKHNDNDNYAPYRGKLLEITHVATSINQHPGYDSAINEALYDLKVLETNEDVPFSLYEHEISTPY